jgi:5-methylcytosine-specific restriction endonuclease McrA
MNPIGPKPGRLRLDPVSYETLRQQILRRDGSVNCAVLCQDLDVHHKEFRSHSGQDSEENLITLCVCCHGETHIPRANP